jgi:hypothetical protein
MVKFKPVGVVLLFGGLCGKPADEFVLSRPDLIASICQVHRVHEAEFAGDILADGKPRAGIRFRSDLAGIDAKRAEMQRLARLPRQLLAGLARDQRQRLRPGRFYLPAARFRRHFACKQ